MTKTQILWVQILALKEIALEKFREREEMGRSVIENDPSLRWDISRHFPEPFQILDAEWKRAYEILGLRKSEFYTRLSGRIYKHIDGKYIVPRIGEIDFDVFEEIIDNDDDDATRIFT